MRSWNEKKKKKLEILAQIKALKPYYLIEDVGSVKKIIKMLTNKSHSDSQDKMIIAK